MKPNDANRSTCLRKTSIGGQALIEGLMMLGPDRRVMAVRLPNGEIHLEELKGRPKGQLDRVPLLRGCLLLFKQMKVGFSAMMRSAELSDLTEPDAAQDQTAKVGFWDRHPDLLLTVSVVIALLLTVLTFFLLPNAFAEGLKWFLGWQAPLSTGQDIALNLMEGVLRILIFIVYLKLSTLNAQIRRVWMYHGAEHKTIACYEARLPLTVENARTMSRFHPRCGTAFFFLVMILSVLLMSLMGWQKAWVNMLLRVICLPLIAGLSYEIIRWAGKYDHLKLAQWVSLPGLKMQDLTTAEPDDAILEVAIACMKAVIPEDETRAAWTA